MWHCFVSDSQVVSALRDHAHLLFPTQEPCACQSRAHAPWQQTAVNHPRTAAPVLVVQRHRLEGGGGGGNGVPGTVVVGIDCNKHRRRHKRGAGGDHQGERLLCNSSHADTDACCPRRCCCTLMPAGHVQVILACPESVLLAAFAFRIRPRTHSRTGVCVEPLPKAFTQPACLKTLMLRNISAGVELYCVPLSFFVGCHSCRRCFFLIRCHRRC